MVKRRRRRHGIWVERERLSLPGVLGQVWSMDFVFDAISAGGGFKCLTVVDHFTKKSADILVEHGISSSRVTRTLDEMAQFRGYPQAVRTDQGPEFIGKELDQRSYQRDIKLRLVLVWQATQNAFITSFHGKFWNECPNETGSAHWSTSEPALRPGSGITTSTDRTASLTFSHR